MKIHIAPDSFKESISAIEICKAVKKGVLHIYPEAEIHEFPLTDGGEGTMENLVFSTGGSIVKTTVSGPMGESVEAGIGLLGDGETAIIGHWGQTPPLRADQRKFMTIPKMFLSVDLLVHLQ